MSPELRECLLRRINEKRTGRPFTIKRAIPHAVARQDTIVEIDGESFQVIGVGAAPDSDWSDHIHLKIGG